jgi:ubiquitin-activating enzyme E1
LFVKPAQAVNSYLSEPGYLDNALKYSGQQKEQVEQITSYLLKDRPITFEECIVWARSQFEERYNNAIRQLLYSLPKDAVTNSGQPFWSSPKRAPDPLTFDSSEVSMLYLFSLDVRLTIRQPTHLQFIISAANLRAFNYGLRGETDPAIFKKVADSVVVPEFTPRSGVRVQVNENEPVDNSGIGTSLNYRTSTNV